MSARQRGLDEVVVVGMGLCTPLGLTARATSVEMAAGTVRFFETDVLDFMGEPVRASVLTLLEPHLSRTERMAAMAVTALQEVLVGVPPDPRDELPLLLALPEPGSGAPFSWEALKKELQGAEVPVRLGMSEDVLFAEGRAGFFGALAEACRRLSTRSAHFVLVGGVDSMCDRDSLASLARAGRCLSSGMREGLLPGEGAGFMLLTTERTARRWRLDPRSWIAGCTLSREPRSFHQRQPNRAEGLTDAFRRLRQDPLAGNQRVGHVLSCQTGEGFWAQEFNFAYLRNAPLMPEPLSMDQVAESLGDVGAAAGVIQCGRALHMMNELEAPPGGAARILVYGCSDAGQVGACVLEGGS